MSTDHRLTLERWAQRLLSPPLQIECPKMSLRSSMGGDVFEGPGHINIVSRNRIEWTMHATPTVSESDAFQRLVKAQNEPYETISQFVLEATDYEGVYWNGGWTHVCRRRLNFDPPGVRSNQIGTR